MSFTDQMPWTVTEKDIRTDWGCVRAKACADTHPQLRCAWCGTRFKVGMTARWVYTNNDDPSTKGIAGNPFICADCDGPREEILARLRALQEEFAAERFWWFRRRIQGRESTQ